MSYELMAAHEAFFKEHVENLRVHRQGIQAIARCPFHEDKVQSLSINLATSQWTCHAGCGHGNALTFSRRKGVSPPDVSGDPVTPPARPVPQTTDATSEKAGSKRGAARGSECAEAAPATSAKKIVMEYQYEFEDGSPAFQVVRFEPKGFAQRRLEGGRWIWGTGDVRRVPYRLPKIISSDGLIFLVEGEKDVHRLEREGLLATTTPMGASNWRSEYAQHFKGRKVVILPDNDEPGENYAQAAARDIRAAGGLVKLVRLPSLPAHGDVSDYLDDPRHSRETLLYLVRSAPVVGEVSHAAIAPVEYFAGIGLYVVDGAGSLPHEFRSLCKEAFETITKSFGENRDPRVHEKVDAADIVWKDCRTKGQYLGFLRLMKEAHEISVTVPA